MRTNSGLKSANANSVNLSEITFYYYKRGKSGKYCGKCGKLEKQAQNFFCAFQAQMGKLLPEKLEHKKIMRKYG